MIGIPLFIELADLEAMYAERAELITGLLSCIDLIFCVKSYLLYSVLQKYVTRITYDSAEDELTFEQ